MENKNLEALAGQLEHKAQVLEDTVAIINLQAKFNYYLELNHTDRIVELFAKEDPDVSCEIGDSGRYVGIESIGRYWNARHKIQSMRGYMGTVMLETPNVTICRNGKEAKGIWHGFGPQSVPVTEPVRRPTGERADLEQTWYMGKYENEYVKEHGEWKIRTMKSLKYFQCAYDKSWVEEPDIYSFKVPDEGCGPDEPGTPYTPYDPDGAVMIWPEVPEQHGMEYDPE